MARGAGGGRPAKDPDQRRNRSQPTKTEIVISADARVADPPSPVLHLNPTQFLVWDAVWAEPVATLWNPVDAAALCRLVILQTTKKTWGDARVLAEMRQLEDRFLLNPYSRAQQRVVIEPPEEVGPGSTAPVTELDQYRNRLQGGRKAPAKKSAERKKPARKKPAKKPPPDSGS